MRVSAKVSVKGTKPILFNTFPIDRLSENRSKSGTTAKNEFEWKDTVLVTKDRQLYVMGCYLVSSIKSAGKLIKVGKSNMMKKIESCLECLDDIIPLKGLYLPEEDQITRLSTDPVYIDVRSVVNPATKGRNLRYRVAAKPGWEISFTIQWDDSVVSKETMKQCVENGGLYEGIGDGRRLGFGRYELLEFHFNK